MMHRAQAQHVNPTGSLIIATILLMILVVLLVGKMLTDRARRHHNGSCITEADV